MIKYSKLLNVSPNKMLQIFITIEISLSLIWGLNVLWYFKNRKIWEQKFFLIISHNLCIFVVFSYETQDTADGTLTRLPKFQSPSKKSTFPYNDKLWQYNKKAQKGKSFPIFLFKKRSTKFNASCLNIIIEIYRFEEAEKCFFFIKYLIAYVYRCLKVLTSSRLGFNT